MAKGIPCCTLNHGYPVMYLSLIQEGILHHQIELESVLVQQLTQTSIDQGEDVNMFF